ncbi:hypothetical protein NN3_01620 [Nocardia neocaledoniensis NBRC 108232]|uniref:Uncharacterized protein n=1 Tax=Nocardia neocaledoniensis TaxID=236511 RepID=A0A317NH25_9NOCA|nr:hypothetical protein [Nocardia neocaledoniensis]PWV74350.1 hypothetical protein DFR69_106161 [Nocardia neocaledoniensis]GEM29155.1 hypothetical protein NN3_01620 [Nocardia neocaledoniensis NBRC 108232]
MPESASHAVTGEVAVTGGPTPMVLSVARRLREAIAHGATFTANDEPRTVRLSSTTDAQQAFLTFVGAQIAVAAHGSEPDLAWEVRWSDPAPAEIDGEALDGFAKEVQVLLSGRDVDWRAAAADFWDRVHAVPGVPGGLGVYCFDEDASAEFGDLTGNGYQLLGTSAALARLFGGRSLITDELAGGELAVDGSVSSFSALFGANLKVVFGEV